jgi:hypothetical protein
MTFSVSWIDDNYKKGQVQERMFGSSAEAWDFRGQLSEKVSPSMEDNTIWSIKVWRHIECGCGKMVTLQGDTECGECGQLYNGAGQKLLPRHMWRESWWHEE